MRSRSVRLATPGSVLAIALIGCGCAAQSSPAPVSPAASPSRHLQGSPARTAGPPPGPAAPPGTLVSAAFVSPAQGWLLLSAPCGRAACLHLEHTTDSGGRWTAVPSAELARPALAGQIEAIRFADPRDGWAYGSGRLLATHDGGRTWRAQALPGLGRPRATVEGLGVLNGTVAALVADGINNDDDGPSQLYTSDAAKDSWRLVPAAGASGGEGSFTAAAGAGAGAGAAYAAFTEESGTAAGTTVTGLALFRSRDGRNWTRLPAPPCPGTPAAATATILYLVCVDGAAAGSTGKLVYASADGGRSWRHLTSAPTGGDLDGVTATPATLLVSWGGGAAGIYVSSDGGRHWATAYTGHIPDGITETAMTTATFGYAIDSRSLLLLTLDAGRHWAAVRAPGLRAPPG